MKFSFRKKIAPLGSLQIDGRTPSYAFNRSLSRKHVQNLVIAPLVHTSGQLQTGNVHYTGDHIVLKLYMAAEQVCEIKSPSSEPL